MTCVGVLDASSGANSLIYTKDATMACVMSASDSR
jgi:hypothetical protein